MRASVDCLSCFVRQALEAVRFAGADERVQEMVLRRVLSELSQFDLSVSPPEVAAKMHRSIREMLGVADPYREAKRRFTERALTAFPKLEQRVSVHPKPFEAAVRLSAAGNVIDLGADGSLQDEAVEAALERAFSAPLDEAAVNGLAEAAASARSILFVADNAGELVFDKLFLTRLPRGRVTVAVKGGPVINDATREDAEQAGIPELAPVIDTGADIPGVVFAESSDAFRRAFDAAELVIAKGQGNYESLSEAPREIYFMLMVKCGPIAEDLGAGRGTLYVGRRTP